MAIDELHARVLKNKASLEEAPKKKRSARAPTKRKPKVEPNLGMKPWILKKMQSLPTRQKQLKQQDICMVLKDAIENSFPDMSEFAEVTITKGPGGGTEKQIIFTVKKMLEKDDVICL
jgi:hypothetical protein